MESIAVPRTSRLTMTPLGQLPFFIHFLKTAGLFDAFVADCPLRYLSPNAPGRVEWDQEADRPEKTVQVDPFQPLRHNHRLLTRPATPRRRRVALYALENARFSPSRQNQTAVSMFNQERHLVTRQAYK